MMTAAKFRKLTDIHGDAGTLVEINSALEHRERLVDIVKAYLACKPMTLFECNLHEAAFRDALKIEVGDA